jgi:F-type H+-transporting ATPase subunit epsilon
MVGSGFFSIAGDEVSILAEQAERGDEVNVAAARQALEEALTSESGDATAERRARARLRAAGQDA